MYLTPLYANPRRRRRSYRRRRYNPSWGYASAADNPRRRYRRRRRNPDFFGIDVGQAGGTILGAIGTAYADSAVVGPLAGRALGALGAFKPAASAVISAFGLHWVLRRVNPRWARDTSGGGALYATIGIANSVAPGLIPITIGVPTQLAGLRPLAAFQPPATSPAPQPTGSTQGGTSTQTGGLRIMSRSGL
jgi:hypothetical protein